MRALASRHLRTQLHTGRVANRNGSDVAACLLLKVPDADPNYRSASTGQSSFAVDLAVTLWKPPA
jgi:hypothetical protein